MKRTVLSTLCMLVLLCMYAKPPGLPAVPPNDSSSSRPGLDKMLADIMAVTGLKSTFILREANVLNLEASISRKQRVILYNPSFVNWLYLTTHDKWATTTLLAHEIGHHLNGHTIRKGGSKPSVELEADEFAGYVLFKLGASLEQTQEVMNYIATPEGSSTHPGRMNRMAALERGWNKARDLD